MADPPEANLPDEATQKQEDPISKEVGTEQSQEEEDRLDYELHILQKMRLAFSASLHMLEAARDDLADMGHRMDRLREASERCRTAMAEKQQNEDAGG